MSKSKLSFMGVVVLMALNSWGDKVPYIQDLIENQCQYEMLQVDALHLVRPLFLECGYNQVVNVLIYHEVVKGEYPKPVYCPITCLKGATPYQYREIAIKNNEYRVLRGSGSEVNTFKESNSNRSASEGLR